MAAFKDSKNGSWYVGSDIPTGKANGCKNSREVLQQNVKLRSGNGNFLWKSNPM